MKKFNVGSIRSGFLQEQVKTENFKLCLYKNVSLFETFYEYSQKQGFALKEQKEVNPQSVGFVAYLIDEQNEQFPGNNGQIVFDRLDFENALLQYEQQLKQKPTTKKKESKE
jgi:hypothetical protein